MNRIVKFFNRIAILFRRNRFRDDLDEEMAFHRSEAERELIKDGMTRGKATDQAATEAAAKLKKRNISVATIIRRMQKRR